jgi:hypothetical protein
MQSWKQRLSLMLAMSAMLLMVSAPAMAEEEDWDWHHGDNWDEEIFEGELFDDFSDDYVALYALEYDDGEVDEVDFLGFYPEEWVEDAEDFHGEWWDE